MEETEDFFQPAWMVPPPRQLRLAWELWQRGDVWRMLAKALTDADLAWAQQCGDEPAL